MQISLLAPSFIALALAAFLLLSLMRGRGRQLAFLAVNLVFIWALLLGPAGTLSTLLFALLGYGLLQWTRRGGPVLLGGALAGFVALFIYMRRYDFLEWFVPASLLTRSLATVGLSFLFFKIIHAMIDARSGRLGRLDLLTYLNYCLNFTAFMMGPIQRYQDYREQWDGEKLAIPLDFEHHLDAVLRVLVGLTKAYVLAAYFQDRALQPDQNVLDLSLNGLLIQTWAFWFYLYLNFAGYCDVVIGTGSLLGVRPPENFDRPFLARNISDFWQRQHRSLTLWLTDYVFNPAYRELLTAASARHRLLAANLSLMLTLLVSGLWHGTTLGFLLFGLVHGTWFVIYHTWTEGLTRWLGRKGVRRFRQNLIVHGAGIVLTFNATAFAFIFFQLSTREVLRLLAIVT